MCTKQSKGPFQVGKNLYQSAYLNSVIYQSGKLLTISALLCCMRVSLYIDAHLIYECSVCLAILALT